MTGSPPQRIAVFSIDVEADYGGIGGEHYRTFDDQTRFGELRQLLIDEAVVPTQFVVASIAEQRPELMEATASLGGEIELHSYSHPNGPHDLEREASQGLEVFERVLGQRPTGYRSPFGRIAESDYAALKRLGFAYSSSVFPTVRPGIANHLSNSLFPEAKGDGLWEIPLACLPVLRSVLSLSYLKFFGRRSYRWAMAATGLPSIVVIDSHLHDFIPTASLKGLSPWRRLRYLHHRDQGLELLQWLISLLRAQGYSFQTLGWLNEALRVDEHPVRNFHTVKVPVRPAAAR